MGIENYFVVNDRKRWERLKKDPRVICQTPEQAASPYSDTGATVSLSTCLSCPVPSCATWTATGEVVTKDGRRVLVRQMNSHASQVP